MVEKTRLRDAVIFRDSKRLQKVKLMVLQNQWLSHGSAAPLNVLETVYFFLLPRQSPIDERDNNFMKVFVLTLVLNRGTDTSNSLP